MILNPVKGTRDFYPDEMRKRTWLFEKFRCTARKYNFVEYDTCVLEHEELYVRKEGDEITGQLYNFIDKGGRHVALRPELTPSLARMIISREKILQFPIKWFCVSQCFRYERMQKGRKREHFQWNMDVVGEQSLIAETELLASIIDFFNSVGLQQHDIHIKYSNRKILQEVLTNIGVPEELFAGVCVIIDKFEKIGVETVTHLLREMKVPDTAIVKIAAFLHARDSEEIKRINGYMPESMIEIQDLFTLCKAYGIDSYVQFDPTIIRGLSYYTGTVFEVFDIKGDNPRAVCGGGRYDKLIESFGGKPLSMVGFGFGDIVITDMLQERDLFPKSTEGEHFLVIAYSDQERDAAIHIATALREHGLSTDVNLSYRKLQKIFARASKQGFQTAILVAPQELKENKVVIKDLNQKTEQIVVIDDFLQSM